MIATFQPYPVSVSCSCLPTLGDPARAQHPFHPRPRLLFPLHSSAERSLSNFCEHLSAIDESACNPKPKSLRQAGRNPCNVGHNDLANDRSPKHAGPYICFWKNSIEPKPRSVPAVAWNGGCVSPPSESSNRWRTSNGTGRPRSNATSIDELAYLSYDDKAADILYEVINRRYERKSIIVTTNRVFKEWNEVFPNATCIATMLDRLLHHADVTVIEGESYRVRESEQEAARRRKK